MNQLIRPLAEFAAQEVGISLDEMYRKRLARRHAWPRFAVMKVAHEHGRQYTLIARHLHFRDHSSIIHGVRRAAELELKDTAFAALIATLRVQADCFEGAVAR